jgi:WD40 repeat protein
MLIFPVLLACQEQIHTRSIPPERITSLASVGDGSYVIGGGESGHIFVWEVRTYRILYNRNCLKVNIGFGSDVCRRVVGDF